MNEVIKLTLTVTQTLKIQPLLEASKAALGYEGVLATISRHYSAHHGATVLELQLVQVPRAKVRKLLKGLADLSKES